LSSIKNTYKIWWLKLALRVTVSSCTPLIFYVPIGADRLPSSNLTLVQLVAQAALTTTSPNVLEAVLVTQQQHQQLDQQSY